MPGGEKIKKKKLTVNLPGRELTLYVAADIEALITDVSDEDKVPCWADVWPAAYGLAYFIWESVDFTPGEKVLELGAGMGLPGIVCGLKGAELTLSDFNPLALEMAAENAGRNGIEVNFLQEDWRSFSSRKKYDYILASDILYDPKLNPFLGKIFHNNLKPSGKIIISHPKRRATYDFLEDWYDRSIFSQECFTREVELADSLLTNYLIMIHILTLL
ncbi:MAG: methyltransferase domain-containing protein [Firmicutes bacterium]|nr:methyltransferase domain-containing protein [Bacillota bacterium]